MPKSTAEIETVIRNGIPLALDFDFRVESVAKNQARARVPYHEKMLRPGGTIAGPVIMTLADATIYAAILATLDSSEMAVTTNLNINFLKRPAPGDLVAEARIIKIGKSSAVCEVEVSTAESNELVAHAVGCYALP